MKIKKIKINAFGGIANKEIELSDNINIIYGKNEAGKSTLLKFITNIFYGTSKNKKGKFTSDYDAFKPWNKDEFSGKIDYELDNGEKYEVFREFSKKTPKIYNSNLEEISKQFNVDKTLGNQFFYDQTKVDENTFMSTVVSMQQEVKLDTQSQNVLIQKIANLAGTGEDNISYKKAMEKLVKKQNEEIGTSRTQERPINVVSQNLNRLKLEKNELEKYKSMKYEYEENKNKIEKQLINLEIQKDVLMATKNLIENQKIEQEKIEYNKQILARNDEKIDKINLEVKNLEQELKNVKPYIENDIPRKSNTKYAIAMLITLLAIIGSAILSQYVIVTIMGIILLGLLGLYAYKINNTQKQIKSAEENKKVEAEKFSNRISQINNKLNSLIAQRNVLENNNEELEKNIETISNKIEKEVAEQKTQITDKAVSYINNNNISEEDKCILIQQINQIQNYKYIQLNQENERTLQDINNMKLELHRMDLNKENIIPKLDNLAKIDEQLKTFEEEYNNLVKKNECMILTKQLLENAYEKMKTSVTPKFTQNLSYNLSKFSNNKYNKVTINDENGLMVELESGEYIPAEKLSVGTIDQLYLALRLSMVSEISEEKLPIILDESFAYFDDDRMKNVMQFIVENYKNRQIILLTCTKREEQCLEMLGVNYNKIVM